MFSNYEAFLFYHCEFSVIKILMFSCSFCLLFAAVVLYGLSWHCCIYILLCDNTSFFSTFLSIPRVTRFISVNCRSFSFPKLFF